MRPEKSARSFGAATIFGLLALAAGCSSQPSSDHGAAGAGGAVTTDPGTASPAPAGSSNGEDSGAPSASVDAGSSVPSSVPVGPTTTDLPLMDLIHQYVSNGDPALLAKIKDLIENHGSSANAVDASGSGTLFNAWDYQTVYWHPTNKPLADLFAYLLSKGADPNMARPASGGGNGGNTILDVVAYDGNMVVVPILVQAGANVNATNASGLTAIDIAARCDFRLSCDDCSQPGGSDLDHLWKEGAKPTIAYLLDHGATLKPSVLTEVPTPCNSSPDLCTPAALPNASWPTGTCKDTYLFVKSKLP